MQAITAKSRYFHIDIVRSIAISAVVLFHLSSDYVEMYGKIPMSQWLAGSL